MIWILEMRRESTHRLRKSKCNERPHPWCFQVTYTNSANAEEHSASAHTLARATRVLTTMKGYSAQIHWMTTKGASWQKSIAFWIINPVRPFDGNGRDSLLQLLRGVQTGSSPEARLPPQWQRNFRPPHLSQLSQLRVSTKSFLKYQLFLKQIEKKLLDSSFRFVKARFVKHQVEFGTLFVKY